ncbi:ectoine hydroxylase-related dioxygenase (phytanoyl-CoA dioxygenase family) [Salinibacter ruber]|uniref:phytanoyl-CoA dioxygenase family protein n=1 Tax=Salinibacter ruber TaxID=146919 RepID=UPI0021676C40|nr:phytanoyl-CoA dioxygenase family protein [Salinibacter ruber]MCS3634881.1 ectoine hydroxylase-related dioxygenase (phytanoyl-CoA dioxygenase family) [Salinibacter ruber]MCS3714644.1 ectoine hydroxylase-related dioxygenase (phytanoyl-CoA dioxygenase family) [Salinibacter ruber]
MEKLKKQNSRRITKKFNQDGFVVIKDLVPGEVTKKATSEIKSILDIEAKRNLNEEVRRRGQFDEHIVKLFRLDEEYRGRLYEVLQDMNSLYQYATCKSIIDISNELGVRAPNIRNVGVRIDIPGEDEYLQPLHQDVNSMRTENCLNFWVPIQKVGPENGALRVFKGSHEIGPIHAEKKELNKDGYESIPKRFVEEYEEIHCTIEPGDAVIFHPYLVHGSETNRSDKVRWTVIVRYDDATQMDWLRDGENPYTSLRKDDAN